MEFREREMLIARIVSGLLRVGRDHWLRPPTREQRLLAQAAYQDAYEDALAQECHTEDTLRAWLVRERLWSDEEEKLLEGLEKDIENLKVGLFQTFANRSKSRAAREALAGAKAKRDGLFARRHAFDQQTCGGLALQARLRYLVRQCLVTPSGRRVRSAAALEEAATRYLTSRLGEAQYRELARTEPWRTTWSCRRSEGSVFGAPACDLTEEQRQLSAYSSLYDNIAEHPHRPSEEVTADDDALDGWLILQRREASKVRPEDFVRNEKILDCDEVFVVVDNDEDARTVESFNDPGAAAVKRQRLHHLSQHGRVQEADMPDTRLYIQTEFNRKAMEAK